MTKEQQKLTEEINSLQGFINTCETALDYGLGLDKATYDKYTQAIARQQELGGQLEAMQGSSQGLYTSAQLMRKETELRIDRCKIEAMVELDRNQFDDFRNHLYDNQEFIKEHRDLMYQDRDGVSHCILVLGEGETDGILVESEGSLYARYAALLPNARDYMQKNIQKMAADILEQGMTQTTNGSWEIGFDEISQHFDTTITPNNGIGRMLIVELEARDELAEIIATEDCIDMTYYLENISAADFDPMCSM